MQDYNITNEDIDNNGYLKEQYPKEINGFFNCHEVPLKSLKGVPKKVKDFYCSRTLITSLEYGPEWVGTDYFCSHTEITSLEGAPIYVGEDFYCVNTKVASLEGIGRKFLKQINSDSFFNNSPIKSNILGLLLVKNLRNFYFNSNKEIQQIINTHLHGDRDILECQEELINKGYKDYAKL